VRDIVGRRLPGATVTLSQPDLIRYAAASGDFNPIHYDTLAAREAGLEGVVAHGMLSMALLGQLTYGWLSRGFVLEEFSARFRGFVVPGQTLLLDGSVKTATLRRVVLSLALTAAGEARPRLTAEAVLGVPEDLSDWPEHLLAEP
jgi:acyl dehydratase